MWFDHEHGVIIFNLPFGGTMLKHIQSSDRWNEKNLAAKGFTLIELLVVIVILGVLGAVVVFSVRGVSQDSKKAACATELRTLATAAEAYYAETDKYPATVTQMQTFGLLNDSTDLVGSAYTINGTTGKVSLAAGATCPKPS